MGESSGAKANKTGNLLERLIKESLESRSYIYVRTKDFRNAQGGTLSNRPIYTTQALIGKTIYDTDRKCDFLLHHPQRFPQNLVIECKWQQASGSVDEKFPFLIENIRLLGIPTIVVVDGGGHKPGAITWMKMQKNDILLGVYTLQEFMIKINDGLCG